VRGEDEDLQLRLLRGCLANERHPVHPGHPEIRHHDVEALGVEPAGCGGSVGRLLHGMTVGFERFGDEGADTLVVVHHQDARHRGAVRES
jgi:hypothetical protein